MAGRRGGKRAVSQRRKTLRGLGYYTRGVLHSADPEVGDLSRDNQALSLDIELQRPIDVRSSDFYPAPGDLQFHKPAGKHTP